MVEISENNKKIARNTLYMYVRMIVMLFISLFTARIVLQILGFENFGIYNVVASIIVFFSFINNGLSLATRRFITAEMTSGSIDSQRRVFNLALLAHCYIAGIILIVSETIGLFIVNSLLDIPENRMFAANVVYQLSVFSSLLGILQSPLGAVVVANENMSIYAYFSIFDVVFKLVLILGMQYLPGDKLIVYALLFFFSSILNVVIYVIYCYRKYIICHLLKLNDKHGLKPMFEYMAWSLFGQGAVVLTNQGVTVLLNLFTGLIANAAMGISNTLTNVVSQFVNNFQIAFNPQITKYYVANEKQMLYSLVIRASRYSNFLTVIFLIPFLFEIDNILYLWLGNYPQYAPEFCILTLICIYIESMGAALWMLIGSDKDIRKYQLWVSVIFLINFVGSYMFLSFGFVPYVVIVVRIFVCFLLLLFRLFWCKKLLSDFPIKYWLKNVLYKSFSVLPLPLLGGYLLSNIDYSNVLLNCILNTALMGFLTLIVIFFIGFEKNERIFVYKKLKSLNIKL